MKSVLARTQTLAWAFTNRSSVLAMCGCLCVMFAASQAWSAPSPIRVESVTREADYTLGSIARQHLTIHLPRGYTLDASSLPAPAGNEAIELRDVHWQIEDLAEESVLMLDIDWQIFVAGDTVKIMPLKKLHLEFQRGSSRLAVDVPADKVIVSSLLPARIDDQHVQLYADVPPPDWTLASQLWSLAMCLTLLALTVLYVAWYLGWIHLPQEKRMPFRQAWRSIRRLGPVQSAALNKQAMRLLSRAMDQFAGYAVTAENLSAVLASHPRLQPHRVALQDFYQHVQLAFFAGESAGVSLDALRQLARSLSHLEVS